MHASQFCWVLMDNFALRCLIVVFSRFCLSFDNFALRSLLLSCRVLSSYIKIFVFMIYFIFKPKSTRRDKKNTMIVPKMYKVHRGRVLLQKVPLGLAKVHGRVDFFWLLSTLKGCVLGIFANPSWQLLPSTRKLGVISRLYIVLVKIS